MAAKALISLDFRHKKKDVRGRLFSLSRGNLNRFSKILIYIYF